MNPNVQDAVVQYRPRIVAYRRVSTGHQKDSGLSLEAQEQMIEEYRAKVNGVIIASFEEVDSGGNERRPELLKALAITLRERATIVVTKLDRLTRSVKLMESILDSKVKFHICDMPDASADDPIMLQIGVLFAQRELRLTRSRTKTALKVLKDRGAALGTRKPHVNAAAHSEEANRKRRASRKITNENAKLERLQKHRQLLPLVRELRDRGEPWTRIAILINAKGHDPERTWDAKSLKCLFGSFVGAA